MSLSVRAWRGVMVTLAAAAVLHAQAPGIAGRLTAEIKRDRAALDSLPNTDFTKNNLGGAKQQLSDAESHLQGNRPLLATELLASVSPHVQGLKLAAAGWGQAGKGIEALEAEWKSGAAGIERDRKKFPARPPAGQSLYVRAVAEQSIGQVKENHAASLEYGRFDGLPSGAYYLGRAQGHMAYALCAAEITSGEKRSAPVLPDLKAEILAVDKALVAAYSKPGATQFHTLFIVANSSTKLAKELNAEGHRAGALITLLRAVFALGQIETKAPAASELAELRSKAEALSKQAASDGRDHSIAEQYLQKAALALEAGAGTEQAAEGQRHRAALLLNYVLPKYFAIVGETK